MPNTNNANLSSTTLTSTPDLDLQQQLSLGLNPLTSPSMLPSMTGAIDLKNGCYLGTAALSPAAAAYGYSSFRTYPGAGYSYPGSGGTPIDYMQYAVTNGTSPAATMATNPYAAITSSATDYWKFSVNN